MGQDFYPQLLWKVLCDASQLGLALRARGDHSAGFTAAHTQLRKALHAFLGAKQQAGDY